LAYDRADAISAGLGMPLLTPLVVLVTILYWGWLALPLT
jgi:hypothetical protein